MPVELHIIRASEFVRLDARELLDFQASKQALRTLAQACRTRGLDCALLDLRLIPIPVKPQFTATELAELVGVFREAGFTKDQRLAILYHHDVHGGIRNFAFIGRIRGLQVQAFSEYEAALNWLSAKPAPRRPAGEEVPVPIKKSPPATRRVATGEDTSRLKRGPMRNS
jgi:hypothetical protein